MANIARKVLQAADKNMTNVHEVEYDEHREFVVDCGNLVPLYACDPHEVCSYSGAEYAPEFKGLVCSISGFGRVGGRA